MALKFFSTHTPGGSGSSKDIKVFDIRLDSDYIVFRGGEDEAASAHLSGTLVLCLADALMIHHVKLTLSGIVHMTYFSPSNSTMSGRRTASKEQTFYEKSWTFKDAGKGRSEQLQSDNYEWPFDVVLDGALPESVEGLRDSWVVYRLKAEICRKRGKDIVVRKPLRIVRTLGATALELSHAMSVENVWPNKIEYSISTPSKAVIFGSFLQVDFKLIPLLKGLVIGNVATQLKEEQETVLDPDWNIAAFNHGVMKEDRIIAWDTFKLEDDIQVLDEEAEGYKFSRYLELPKSLNKCLQDCNVKGIKVRHKIKFNVQLLNPDGHVSELRANLPVSLYISHNLPLNENNDLIDQTPQASRAAIENDLAHAAPPVYGQHTLDQLYSDVDPSGYKTPGAALSTPGTPYSHSRNISSENLPSLDAITNGTSHVSASALQYRLQNLRMSDRNIASSPTGDDHEQPRSGIISRRASYGVNNSDYFSASSAPRESGDVNHVRASPPGGQNHVNGHSGRSSQSGSAQISRQTSAEYTRLTPPGPRSPPILADHYEDLAKVPSYSTAVKTPAPRSRTMQEGLPTYGAVLSGDQPSMPSEPSSAHLSLSGNGSWRDDGRNAAATAMANGLGGGRTSTQPRLETLPSSSRRSLAGR